VVQIGRVKIGGKHPIAVQSMTTTDTRDVTSTIRQIRRLQRAGCEIVRVAILDRQAAVASKEIKKRTDLPVVADIHFDYRLALESLKSGVDKLRLNPGNIGAPWKVREVVRAAADRGVPVRVGANSGSIPRDLLKKHKHATPEALVEAAARQVELLDSLNFNSIVVSLKSSSVPVTIEAYRLMSKKANYPLHLGITEAGPLLVGSVRSAVGLGVLLAEGIGDTLRVSLTGDPVQEVRVGFEILKSLDLRERGPILISCPICGRCEIDLERLVRKVERKIADIDVPIKVAVMGCVVNGPGEAREADVGIAGGRGVGLLFRKGRIVRKLKEGELEAALLQEIERMASN
jgi:(E)-4-hydroxy-3-methylbut-2-enyl-diphosphate synthase